MKKIKGFFCDYLPTIIIFLLVIFAYIMGTEKEILDRYLFPTVGEIIESFQRYLPKMFLNMFHSFGILIPSVAAGTLVGLLIGLPMGLNRRVRKIFHPIIYSVSVIPSILLSPFLLHLAPTFRMASIILVFYNFVWAIIFATINGVMTIENSYLDKAKTLQINGLKRITKVIIPAAMPTIVSGFISSMRASFIVLVYAEMYGTEFGMGYFVKWNSDLGRFEHVWSGFIFLSIVLVVVMLIVEKIKNRILKWAI